jgi:hypothetical protein
MDFAWDKQTTTWNNQTTVNTPLTNRHNCNLGDQQATEGLQRALNDLRGTKSLAHHQLG